MAFVAAPIQAKGYFGQSLRNLGTAMPAVERLTLQVWGGRAGCGLLRGIAWPAGLTHLTLYKNVQLDGISVPPRVSSTYRNRAW